MVAGNWAAMEQEIDRLLAEAQSRPAERPVLRGPALPGRAWEKYDQAFSQLDLPNQIRRRLENPDLQSQDMLENQEWKEQCLRALAPAVEPFREGLSRANGQRYRNWQGPEQRKSSSLVPLGQAQAMGLAKGGDAREAARWLLDLIQFCGDFGRNGSLEDAQEAGMRRGPVLADLKKLILSGALGQAGHAELARELELADLAFPSIKDVLRNTALSQGCMYVDLARHGTLLGPDVRPSWRFLFSERALITASFFSELVCLERMAEAEGKPWAEAREEEQQALARFDAARNPILDHHASWWPMERKSGSLLQANRVQRAQLRLLLAAARYLATGTVATLEDPFGTLLRNVLEADRLRIWSVGPDGLDQGGTGGWDSKPGADIVLELNR